MKRETSSRRGMFGGITLGVAVVLFVIDQVTKGQVLRDLRPVGSVVLLPGLLEFSYVENTGAAFGMFSNAIWLIGGLSVLVSIAIIVALFRYARHDLWSYAASCLILSGGAGNLVDRVQYGHVVDFIHVLFFPYVFNFADCCITVGACCLVIHALLLARRENKRENFGS